MIARLLLWIGIYVLATATCVGIGVWLLIAPVRAGAFLHQYFAAFPPPSSPRRALGFRLLGVALLLFGLLFGIPMSLSVVHLALPHLS